MRNIRRGSGAVLVAGLITVAVPRPAPAQPPVTPAPVTPVVPRAPGPTRALSQQERAAVVRDANRAIHQYLHGDVKVRKGDQIPRRFWGDAILHLRPVRVFSDSLNVAIVLREDDTAEQGLYVTVPISSYAPGQDRRFAAFERLSAPEDKSFGELYRYSIQKHARTAKAVPSYEEAQTLGEALALAKLQLTREDKKQFLPLLSEPAVRQAIRSALASYEAGRSVIAPTASQERQREVFEYFKAVAPTYRQIAETGEWPEGASFTVFYGLGRENGITYQGLGVRLEVATPDKGFPGFALPIVDVWYGKTH